jgi:hypothetical protein
MTDREIRSAQLALAETHIQTAALALRRGELAAASAALEQAVKIVKQTSPTVH